MPKPAKQVITVELSERDRELLSSLLKQLEGRGQRDTQARTGAGRLTEITRDTPDASGSRLLLRKVSGSVPDNGEGDFLLGQVSDKIGED